MLSYMSPSSLSSASVSTGAAGSVFLNRPFEEYNLLIEQAVTGERRFHLLERYREFRIGVKFKSRIGGHAL